VAESLDPVTNLAMPRGELKVEGSRTPPRDLVAVAQGSTNHTALRLGVFEEVCGRGVAGPRSSEVAPKVR